MGCPPCPRGVGWGWIRGFALDPARPRVSLAQPRASLAQPQALKPPRSTPKSHPSPGICPQEGEFGHRGVPGAPSLERRPWGCSGLCQLILGVLKHFWAPEPPVDPPSTLEMPDPTSALPKCLGPEHAGKKTSRQSLRTEIFFSPPSETFLLTAALTSAPPRCHKCHLLTQECPNHPQLLSPTLRNPAGPLSVPPAGADPARVGNDALRHPELSPRLRHPRSAYLGREGCVGISRGPAGPGGCRGLGCEAELGWWLAECGCVCPKPLQHLCIRMCSSLSSLLACALPRSLPTTTPLPGDGELFFF